MNRQSLQYRLVWRLALVFLVAAAAITAGVVLESWESAAALDRDDLAHALLAEYLSDVVWLIPVIAAAALVMVVLTVRRGLRPLRHTSALAARIGPERTDIRLPEAELPSELVPLVASFNEALDRLDAAFAQQRRFTAEAAHQLRTPLAILTAKLDSLECDGEIAALREDAARMNRLVDQLLRVARLEAHPPDVSEPVDLAARARAAVSALAPLAVQRGRELSLAGAAGPVPIAGSASAIDDALRNVIENALAHTPEGTEVTVSVDGAGRVSVADQGPGIAAQDRPHLFERFWRGRDASDTGAGLGLAIVTEVMRAHGGRVTIDDRESGGAVFTLVFRESG